jgi:tetratricopeptide (TPR) repeat protein
MRWVTPATLFAFLMACLWPYASRAADAAPPPQQAAVSDEALTQAKNHFEAGRNAYNAQDYITAIREFKAAEALRPSPILAYNIGLANEKLGKKRVALKYYHRYLEQMPNAQNKPEVDQRIAGLEAELASAPPPPPPGQPPPPQANPEQPGDNPPPQANPQPGYDPYASSAQPLPPTQPPQKKKSYWWVWLLVAGGAAIVIAVIVAVAVVYGDSSPYYYADHALMTNPRDPSSSSGRTPGTTLPLIHF